MKTNHQRGFVARSDFDSSVKWTAHERGKPDCPTVVRSYSEQLSAAPRPARVGNRTSTRKYRSK